MIIRWGDRFILYLFFNFIVEIILESNFFTFNNFTNNSGLKGYFWENWHKSNQYSVSSDSLAAIFNLWIKSALLSLFYASLTFAPIDVHDFRIWFEITNFRCSSSNSENEIISNANSKLNSKISFLFSKTNLYHNIIYTSPNQYIITSSNHHIFPSSAKL